MLNPHEYVAKAEAWLAAEETSSKRAEHRATMLARAQVYATLALVAEAEYALIDKQTSASSGGSDG